MEGVLSVFGPEMISKSKLVVWYLEMIVGGDLLYPSCFESSSPPKDCVMPISGGP